MKNFDSDTLFGVSARGSTRSMLGYGLCKLVAGETALCKRRPLHCSKYIYFRTLSTYTLFGKLMLPALSSSVTTYVDPHIFKVFRV